MTDSLPPAHPPLVYRAGSLAGLPALALPTDRPRDATRPWQGALHTFQVPAKVAQGVTDLAVEAGSCLRDALFTACQILFSRYGQQSDLALATPAAGRAVAVRTVVEAETPFTVLLAETTRALAETLPDADVVGGESADYDEGTVRDDAGHPVVPVLVALAETGGSGFDLWFDLFDLAEGFDLALGFAPAASGELAGVVAYDATLFEAATARRLATNLVALLTDAVTEPSRPVGDLMLVSEEELRTLITDWGTNRSAFPADRCLHDLVGDQAGIRPEAVAVVDGTTTLTYAQLDAQANRLANLLLAEGARPRGVVGICLPRGAELVAAMLGVLKAGCAFMPLDPAYPSERLRFMLEDADAAVCVTRSGLAGQLPAGQAKLLCLDERQSDLAGQSPAEPQVDVSARDGAQVLFTSGSTGRPKGVMIEHRSLARLVCNADYVALTPEDVVIQGANVTFDAATFEVWAPLVAGARMVVIDNSTLLDPAALIATLREHQVTTLFLTPVVLNQVIATDPAAFGDLRHLLTGGEAMNPARAAQVLSAARPPKRLVNLYGPTETTMLATWHVVTAADVTSSVPIGRPVSNTSIYVLDERLNPVPIGVPGELMVAGPGVARGYLKRPELTAERFLDNPFATEPGDRIYRTGDLVRWKPEGVLEYLGRADHQVKIRGHRVEPAEIELTLEQHPDVDAAVVVVRVEDDHKRLVGYVRPAPGRRPDPAGLREFVAGRLPDFMVPAALVTLEEFPLTSSGKVDRAALPAPAAGQGTGARRGVAPRTSTERALAEIWAEVLKVPHVGVTDNFYELGGDSILGVRVVARARRAGISISTKAILKHQTVAELALLVGDGSPPPPAPGPQPASPRSGGEQ